MKKIIFWLFTALLFFVPIILWPYTSEVFEFNKIVLVYFLTTIIFASWIIRMISERKFIFRRTILDIPLLTFLASQFVSTILSIDPLTSWLGYYSRFNGGLLSSICYSILYWAFVSNLGRDDSLKLINFSLLPSAFLVSAYGVLEHFGIDKNIWVQDVQSRVFSTLGQPNWLAAWLTALLPITWASTITNYQLPIFKNKKFWVYFLLSILFFWTLIFTKSRSGLLGFAITFIIFWGLHFWQNRHKKNLIPFVIVSSSILIISLISGTEYTPNLGQIISKSTNTQINKLQTGDTALETGGTESGTIRKIVWKGAIQVWLHYPIFGTGVETFAYSYYRYRPAEHNTTSEWDFIYNKAHNEFLNFMANSGTVGIISYLTLILFSIVSIINKLKNDQMINSMKIGLLAGYASLLVTNFFGFSVVPTQLEFFLFPAFAVAIRNKTQVTRSEEITSRAQKVLIAILSLVTFYLLLLISRYWYADTLYAKGKAYNGIGKPDVATNYLTQAISLEPNQAIYVSELANSYTAIALALNQQNDKTNSKKFIDMAVSETTNAVSLSGANLNLKRSEFGVYIRLSTIDPAFLIPARDTLLDAITFAPTDAKLYYNLGLTEARLGDIPDAMNTFKKTIDLKANYKDARLAYAILLIDKKQFDEAKTQLNYILTNIDPNDSLTKQTLEGIR